MKSALASILTLAWAAPGLAQTPRGDLSPSPSRPITLERAVEEALAGNPGLRVAGARRDLAGSANEQ